MQKVKNGAAHAKQPHRESLHLHGFTRLDRLLQ